MAKKAIYNKCELWRGGNVSNRLSRLKYFRGHGVHSPFVYSLMRNVFMSRQLKDAKSGLIVSLASHGITKRSAIEVSNIITHCGYSNIAIDRLDAQSHMVICSNECSDEQLLSLVDSARTSGTTIVIELPYRRRALCNEILKAHKGTSIDRLEYMIILNNHLPKQHFKL